MASNILSSGIRLTLPSSGYIRLSDGTLIKIPAASGEVITCTGIVSALSQGSLGTASSSTLSGNAITSAIGDVSVFVVGDVVLTLAGNSLSALLNSLVPLTSTGLIGESGSNTLGALIPSSTLSLNTALLQAAQYSIRNSLSKRLSGSLLNGSLGFLQLLDGSVTLPLTGNVAFLSQDVLLPLSEKGISGTSIVLSLEQLTSLKDKLLSGQSTVFSQGTTGVVVSKTTTGSLILSGQGSLLFADSNITTALSGSSFTSLQGVLAVLGDIEPVINKVVVQGTSYTLVTFNTLNKIIT